MATYEGTAGTFGEVEVHAQDGFVFVDVSADGFGCGVCLTASDARRLQHQLTEALAEIDRVQN